MRKYMPLILLALIILTLISRYGADREFHQLVETSSTVTPEMLHSLMTFIGLEIASWVILLYAFISGDVKDLKDKIDGISSNKVD